jgi:hypothetical protein
MMTKESAQSFSVWLLKTHPDLFYAIAKQQNPGLNGISDVLSNIGGAFSSAVSSVGSWVSNPENLKSLTSLAGTYFSTQAAQNVADAQLAALQTQTNRAQAGQPAAPISYGYDANNNLVPVYTGTNTLPGLGTQVSLPSGQYGYTLSSSSLNALQPSFLQKYGLWLGVGGAALFVAYLAIG